MWLSISRVGWLCRCYTRAADAAVTGIVSEMPDLVVVHGICNGERARSLIYSMAEIPCYPSVIFRIDRWGKLIGAINQLEQPARIYFITVLNWNYRSKKRPVIAWTSRPSDVSSGLSIRAHRVLGLYSSKLRGKPPMTVKVDVQEHAALYAKMTRIAS